MAEEKKVTPEEKLLKVIQGKDKGEKSAPGPAGEQGKPAARKEDPPTPPPAVRPAASVSPEPKASVRPGPAPAQTRPAPAATRTSAPAPTPAVESVKEAKASPATRASLKAPTSDRLDVRSRTLAVVNRLLRILIVLMAGISCWAVWASSSKETVPGIRVRGGSDSLSVDVDASSKSCAAVVAAFEGKTLFVPVGEDKVEVTVTNLVKKPTISEAQQYISRNLNLIGVSPGRDGTLVEAIFTDAQTKRNYFLKLGGKITINSWELELKQIAADHAILLCGKEEVRVE